MYTAIVVVLCVIGLVESKLFDGRRGTWRLQASSEEANEAAGTRAMSSVRLLANGIHADGVNAGSRVASSGTWRMMQKQGSSDTAPAAWRVACGGGQLRRGRFTGVRSGQEWARAAEASRIWTGLEEDCAPGVEDEWRRCGTLGGSRARGRQGREDAWRPEGARRRGKKAQRRPWPR